jgi:transcription antitermination factor NusG
MGRELKKGDNIKFVSGNFQGLFATVSDVDYDSKDKRAMYGYLHTVQLSNGKIGYIEKSEHWRYVLKQNK